ncbi:Survival factor 1 [Grifola frondosa]|uniref:Survival factor 1 n=1 Tax=Grifola frondosa TaxID=5627 RepID=A0A1C7M5G8_GRIFR|nr:Survival factor 1 [Grifola frondosa]
MFSSLFSTVPPTDPNAPNFHPVSEAFEPSEMFGELEPKDTEWVCPGGFAVETMIYYNILEDGTSLMCQVIHSAVGVWYPTIQFTCKMYNPTTKETTWKSVNITNFVTPPPGLDKRSSKGDQFSIIHKSNPDSDTAESYAITAKLGDDLQISVTASRAANMPGFKLGKGPKGGTSYFGTDTEKPESYVLHKFWPRDYMTGVVVHNGKIIEAKGPGMFVHAIQGMRPNLVAARWNFAHFESEQHGGVSAIQMELTTTETYGRKGPGSGFVSVNVGSLVLGGKLAVVTAETKWPDEALPDGVGVMSRAVHSKTALDPDTGYDAPTELVFRWAGPSIVPDAQGAIDATLTVDVGPPDASKGLIEKVDVLAEIPYVIKTMVNYVAGTKPYIYQWHNPATLNVSIPSGIIPGESGEVKIDGWLYNEATVESEIGQLLWLRWTKYPRALSRSTMCYVAFSITQLTPSKLTPVFPRTSSTTILQHQGQISQAPLRADLREPNRHRAAPYLDDTRTRIFSTSRNFPSTSNSLEGGAYFHGLLGAEQRYTNTLPTYSNVRGSRSSFVTSSDRPSPSNVQQSGGFSESLRNSCRLPVADPSTKGVRSLRTPIHHLPWPELGSLPCLGDPKWFVSASRNCPPLLKWSANDVNCARLQRTVTELVQCRIFSHIPSGVKRGCPSWLVVDSMAKGTRSLHTQSRNRRSWHGRGGYHSLLQTDERHLRPVFPYLLVSGARLFHATPKNQGGPLLPLLAGLLKTSTALEFARMAARVGLTFLPIIMLKNMKSKRQLRWAEAQGHPDLDAKKDMVMRGIRNRTLVFHALLFIPIVLFWATILASLERTPLTGRWRIILLSPEEEEDIAAQLAGPGWYHAVGEILSADGPVKLIPPSDWRLSWVQDTLRRLESVIPTLQREQEVVPHWVECGPDDIPLPPPAEYPLRPRPRGSEYLRRFAELTCARTVPPAPHSIAGPPYSLIVVDKPESSNAFSYGFGPEGGGGIVVFSGFLDDVLSKNQPEQAYTPPEERTWLSALFGSLFSIGATPPSRPEPTPEQTSELAILLAHELAHLVLSHHIETLSSGSIIWPGVMSIVTDVVRAFLFPVTMLFGPFINDALAGVGKAGSGEITKLQEFCTSQKQEIEADVVSARLLAHAGFDPRHSVRFWEERQDTPQNAECSPARAEAELSAAESLQHRWIGSTHPVHTVRVDRLKLELERWEDERRAAARQKQLMQQSEAEV